MAVVYLARDLRHVRDVAVKIFRLEGEEPAEGSQRFLQEIQIAARLSHPNILPLHDSGEAEGLLYYVMPYVPGETLRQRLEREGALPVEDSLRIAEDVAGALAYAHSHGVIHRDIKPENILFIADHAVVADFGIARAISAGGLDEWKLAGPAGTPTYMSPEQARGGSRVDGRSDLYSLGCVLYEMLTGEPPFRGSTPEEVVVQHLEVEPLPVQTRRPTLTPELQAAVGRALAKHPADRYQTAQQMADALGRLQNDDAGLLGPDGSLRRRTPGSPRPAMPSGSWLRQWAAPGLAALGIVLAVLWTTASRTPQLDPSLYLVAPFEHRQGVPSMLSGEQCSRLVYDALGRWADVRLSDRRWVEDQLARMGEQVSLADLLSLARRGGAGKLLTGEVSAWGDSVRVRGVVYDVSRGPEAQRQKTVTFGANLVDAERNFGELADSLLLPRPTQPVAATGIFGTRLIGAWQTYDSAHSALATWDLSRAARLFRAAVSLDPSYGLAHLWLAQTQSWQGIEPSLWRDDAVAGLAAQPPLSGAERVWAAGLVALAEERYPDACRQFDMMIRRDTLDFRGWFGRAECRARDRLVIKDQASPSGWRFRSSYQSAINDYQRALMLVPSVHRAFKGAAFERLTQYLFAEPNVVRLGHGEGPNPMRFAGVPGLQADTITIVPRPFEELRDPKRAVAIDQLLAAIAHNRDLLRRITGSWVASFPTSPAAIESEARALELVGELSSSPTASDSALGKYRSARRLSSDATEKIDLGVSELRVLLKLERFSEARRLADSLLAESATAPSESATLLAGVAALTGRAALAASLMQRAAGAMEIWSPAGQPLTVPLPLRETASALEAYSALGAPSDSIQAVVRRIYRQLGTLVRGVDRDQTARAILPRSLALAAPVPVLAGQAGALSGADYLLDLQLASYAGDTVAVRAGLRRLAQLRTGFRPGDIAIEVTLQEAMLQLALGDSLAAARRLDGVLQALPSFGEDLVGRVQQAGALVRIMKLRAELAARSGEFDIARRWTTPVVALWSSGEPSFRQQAEDLRRLTSVN